VLDADGGMEAFDAELAAEDGYRDAGAAGCVEGKVILIPRGELDGDDDGVLGVRGEIRGIWQGMDLRIY
jgi:hypothetical protein